MPVFHFTFHAYRSWHEDHEKGFHQRGEGLHRPNPVLAAHRNRIANDDEVRFDDGQMRLLLDAVLSTCERKTWRAHAACATATHVHAVVSWTAEQTPGKVAEGLKSGLGFCLSKAKGTTGNRWFSRGGAPKRVEDHAHLYHLKHDYLPNHAKEEGGVFRDFEIPQ